MWEYKGVTIIVERDETIEAKLNEYGKDGWEAFSITEKPYAPLNIGRFPIYTGMIYNVKLKKRVE